MTMTQGTAALRYTEEGLKNHGTISETAQQPKRDTSNTYPCAVILRAIGQLAQAKVIFA